MAYPNSFLLFAFFLFATTSVVNSQLIFPGLPPTYVIVGMLNNFTSPGGQTTQLGGVNVSLSCNGGQTTVGPVVTTNPSGVFTITLLPTITVNPINCIVVANITSLINSSSSFARSVLGATISLVDSTLGFSNVTLMAAGGFLRALL
ncbi:hypothetical protein PanWU01x14_175550 [Parasponia andersonii]|uniref:Immunoglobulin-like fold containing protein n=1 Tax=Parasponia andersonii TaxID=3476 RepID=A0A2P5C8H3_PARAD|nr:hypothetical protein PanWU01x14_175550 [Parasponia andersonii]